MLSKIALSVAAFLATGDAAFDYQSRGSGSSKLLSDILADLKVYGNEQLKAASASESVPSEYPYFNIFPTYISTMFDLKPPVVWSSKCFNSNTGSIKISDDKSQILVAIESDDPVKLSASQETCEDFYLLACTSSSSNILISSSRTAESVTTSSTLDLPQDITEAEWFDIDTKGIRLSVYPNGPVATFSNLLETVALFSPEITGNFNDASDARVMDFMNAYTSFDTIVSADPDSFVHPDASEIHSGT